MRVKKSLSVFGDPVDILVSGEETNNAVAVVTQTCRPGGGPPPHIHEHEDEIFQLIEGEFEILQGDTWMPLLPGELMLGKRGEWHTFKNVGSTLGTIMVTAAPAGLERYLEEIDELSPDSDLEQILETTSRYGMRLAAVGEAALMPVKPGFSAC